MSSLLKKSLPTIISGILLGLSYPSFPEIPTGILAWFAFVPILLITRNTTNFKEYFWLTFSAFLISGPLNFWWTALYSWKAFALCCITQIWGVYLPFLLHFFLFFIPPLFIIFPASSCCFFSFLPFYFYALLLRLSFLISN